jgi:hypothetical protein
MREVRCIIKFLVQANIVVIAIAIGIGLACGGKNSPLPAATNLGIVPRDAAQLGGASFLRMVARTVDSAVATANDDWNETVLSATDVCAVPGAGDSCRVAGRTAAARPAATTAAIAIPTASAKSVGAKSCATAPLRTSSATDDHGHGTIHYFCSIGGSDSYDGLSPYHAGGLHGPKASLAAIASTFNSMAAGDTVALCLDGRWTGVLGTIHNSRCMAANTCDFREYPVGGSGAKPIISGSGGAVFSFSVGASVFTSGMRFWNIEVQPGEGGTGFWLTGAAYGGAKDVDICNVTFSGGDSGVVDQFDDERITVRNCRFMNTKKHAILAGSNDLLVDSNYFENCGSADARTHTIYIQQKPYSSPSGAYLRERVINNEIHVSACGGSIVIAHGRHNDMVIENNLIDASAATDWVQAVTPDTGQYLATCSGIEVDCQYDLAWGLCTNSGARVRRNRVFLGGAAWGVRVSQCPNCELTDNVFVNIRGGDGIRIGYDSYGTLPSDNMKIENNTIYMMQGGGYGIVIGEGSGHVVTNNAVWYPTGIGGPWPHVKGASATVNANNRSQTTPGNAAAWWKSPAGKPTADFTPGVGSPLIRAGNSTYYSPTAPAGAKWTASDSGKSRSPPIDIGALASP